MSSINLGNFGEIINQLTGNIPSGLSKNTPLGIIGILIIIRYRF